MRLFRMYWRRTLRRPGALLVWLALPFVFMAIYTLVFGGDDRPARTRLAVVDEDSTLVSRFVRGAFGQGPVAEMLEVVEAEDMAAVEALFADGQASAALVLPAGFGDRLLRMEPDTLVLHRNPRHTIGPQIAEGVLGAMVIMGNGLLERFAGPMREVAGMMDAPGEPDTDRIGEVSKSFYAAGRDARGLAAVRGIDVSIIQDEKKKDEGFNLAALFFPGLVMFGLLTVSLHVEHRFLRDRTRHVTRRLVVAPVSPWSVAVQQRLYTASFVYAVGVLSALVGGIIWRIPPQGLATANLIVIALALFVSGFNGILFSLSSSERAVSAISSIAMTFLAMLGGGFFPAELAPPAFQSISKMIPTGMANYGLTHALTGRDAGISIPLLFAYCGAFFAAGVLVARRRVP